VVFLLAVITITSLATCVLGVWRLRLARGYILAALGLMLEAVGTACLLLIANVAVALAVVVGTRVLTRSFVSLYPAFDPIFVALSLLQGFFFHAWQRLSDRAR
jgi:hypothetical protein